MMTGENIMHPIKMTRRAVAPEPKIRARFTFRKA